jgi:hypothetical protein
MPLGQDNRSIPQLFTDVLNRFSLLLRTEAQLARAEMSEKVGHAVNGLVFIVAGAVLMIPALVILLQAAAAALAEAGFSTAAAAGIIGGAVFVIGIILALVGMAMLNTRNLAPNKTIHQLQRDVSVAKQQMRGEDVTVQRAA